jgi:flagellar motor switch protein FliN/FliY
MTDPQAEQSPKAPDAQAAAAAPVDPDLARIMDVKVEVTVELGRRRLSIAEVLQLAPNAMLEFFKRPDEPLDIRVNGRLVARGEAVVLGERYGVRVTEVVKPNANPFSEDANR